MSEARWRTLHHLARHGGEITQGRLVERLGIRGPTLVTQLDQLEAEGWVERRSDPSDRRSNIVSLTAKGKPMTERIENEIDSLRNELFSGVDSQELATCLTVLGSLKERVIEMRECSLAKSDTPSPNTSPQGAVH
jgi:MarR family transcriptional regulator for hemolysin